MMLRLRQPREHEIDIGGILLSPSRWVLERNEAGSFTEAFEMGGLEKICFMEHSDKLIQQIND